MCKHCCSCCDSGSNCVISFWHVIPVLNWPLPFPYAPKKSSMLWSVFLWAEGVLGAETYILCQWNVHDWIKYFKQGHTSVTDEEQLVYKTTSTTADNVRGKYNMVLANRCVTMDKVAASLCICNGSAHEIIHNNTDFHKPSKPAYRRTYHLEICQHLLNCNHDKVMPL